MLSFLVVADMREALHVQLDIEIEKEKVRREELFVQVDIVIEKVVAKRGRGRWH